MRGALLQLTLWAAAVHAFIPFIPDDQCDPGEHCGPFGHADKRGASASGGNGGAPDEAPQGITFDLHHRANAVCSFWEGGFCLWAPRDGDAGRRC